MKQLYKPLEIDFDIDEDLQIAISNLISYLNAEENNYKFDDCYRTEVNIEINAGIREGWLSREQADMLKDYYVHKGIHRK